MNLLELLTHAQAHDEDAILYLFQKLKNVYMLQAACCVSASIAFVIPQRQNLSGVLLKPFRAWDYPSKLPFGDKRRCLLV